MYAQQLEGDSWKDAKMDKSKIDKMSGQSHALLHACFSDTMTPDEQIAQLYELMQAIRNQDLDESQNK